MIYDAVMCVGKQHVDIAIKSIQSLLLFSHTRKLFVISPRSTLDLIEIKLCELGELSHIILLDEEQVLFGVDIKTVRENFEKKAGGNQRFGWYLQQFLKMSASELPEIADYFLIWDSDTVLLQEIFFFDEHGKVLIAPSSEYHEPYFRLIDKVLGIKRQASHSFISEHFMVKKEYMKCLIENIITNAPKDTSWIEFIIESIDEKNILKSGFSEYETYGNFIATKFSESFLCRVIKSTRQGTMIYGNHPDRYAFFDLMRSGFVYATFECWQSPPAKLNRVVRSCLIRISWILCKLTRRYSGQLRAAAKLDSFPTYCKGNN